MLIPIQPVHWQKMPFARILAPYILGILAQDYFSIQIDYPIILLSISLIVLFIFTIIKIKEILKNYISIFIFLPLILLGITNKYYSEKQLTNNHYLTHQNKEQNTYSGVIKNSKKKTKTIQLHIQLTDYQKTNSNSQSTNGILIAYLKGPINTTLIGQKIIFQNSFHLLDPPENPEAFNYKDYLSRQGIFHFIYLDSTNYLLLPDNEPSRLWLSGIRSQLLELLQNRLSDPWQYQIAAAMILGDRSDMDRELRDQFADTGLMHILAVSGLHIGIVYTLLFYLFGKIRSSLIAVRILQTVLILGGIWIFVLIAGAPSSAVRAGFLFSVVQFGRLLRRDASIYNSLAAAAFCLLVWQPSWIKDIGFQLSFAAVWGIVYFQPLIFQLFLPPGRVGHYIWSLTSVSIAAQLVTTPICLYYFHQVPVYFWLSGLIGIPLAPVILFSGISFITSSFFLDPLANLFGWFLESALWILQSSTSTIAGFPGVHLGKEIWINSTELFLFYLILFLGILYLETRDKKWILIILLGSIIYSTAVLFKPKYSVLIVTFYAIRSAQVVDIFHPKEAYCIADGAANTTIQYASANWRTRNGISSRHLSNISKDTSIWRSNLMMHQNIIELEDIRVYWGKTYDSNQKTDSEKFEILYVVKNDQKWRTTNNVFPEVVILDRNLKLFQVRKWQAWADENQVLCLNMYDLGAIWISQTETQYLVQNQNEILSTIPRIIR